MKRNLLDQAIYVRLEGIRSGDSSTAHAHTPGSTLNKNEGKATTLGHEGEGSWKWHNMKELRIRCATGGGSRTQ